MPRAQYIESYLSLEMDAWYGQKLELEKYRKLAKGDHCE
jgi:hypothetical protein